MKTQSIKRIAGLSLLVAALACPSAVQASLTVHSGWDLLATVPDSLDFLTGTYWKGVPLNTYDFGGSIGVRDVSYTDTIIHRTSDATAPVYDSWVTGIPVEIAALQLKSVNPTDLGAGLGDYFVTLTPGLMSGGTMDIFFGPEGDPHGTWNSSMNLYFDIRYGSLNGPVVLSTSDVITAGSSWRHEENGDQLLLSGVNYRLNGTDTSEDFWPGNPLPPPGPLPPCQTHTVYEFEEDGIIVYHHVVSVCPEPSMCALVFSGVALLGWRSLRRKLLAAQR